MFKAIKYFENIVCKKVTKLVDKYNQNKAHIKISTISPLNHVVVVSKVENNVKYFCTTKKSLIKYFRKSSISMYSYNFWEQDVCFETMHSEHKHERVGQ